jgi:hypothetical protein
MSYLIINKNGTPMDTPHFNGGWDLKNDFPFRNSCYMVFKTKTEAKEMLASLAPRAIEQKERWGREYTSQVLLIIKELSVGKQVVKKLEGGDIK